MLQLLASHQGLLRIIILFFYYYFYKFEVFCLIQELQSVSASVSIIYVKVDICLGLVISVLTFRCFCQWTSDSTHTVRYEDELKGRDHEPHVAV